MSNVELWLKEMGHLEKPFEEDPVVIEFNRAVKLIRAQREFIMNIRQAKEIYVGYSYEAALEHMIKKADEVLKYFPEYK